MLAACGGGKTPSIPVGPINPPYDFTYTYQTPAKPGGTVTIGNTQFPDSLSPIADLVGGSMVDTEVASGLSDGCVVQLPDLSLGDAGYKADQCKTVPTVINGGESADGLTTIMKLDPAAVWSDGMPITADDYLLQYDMASDPFIGGDITPWSLMKSVTKVDDHTLVIVWTAPYAPYLSALWNPVPVHVYNGKYTGLYQPATAISAAKYTSSIAQKLVKDPIATTTITVTNGAFTVQRFDAKESTIVLAKNPRFHSNYFHAPTLDSVVFKATSDTKALIAAYKAGQYDHIEGLTLGNSPKSTGLPASEQVVSPRISIEHLTFNLREVAPNAKQTTDHQSCLRCGVRLALIEGFDLCGALKTILGFAACADPNLITDELTAPPAYDDNASVTPPTSGGNSGVAPNQGAVVPLVDALKNGCSGSRFAAEQAYTGASGSQAQAPAYDPALASQMLDEAGYLKNANGLRTMPDNALKVEARPIMTLKLVTTNNDSTRASFVELLKQAWEALGIPVVVATYSPAQLFASYTDGGILAKGAYDVALFSTTRAADPDGLTSIVQSGQVPSAINPYGFNYGGINDPIVDTLLAQGRATLDGAKREQTYQQLQQIIAAQAFFLPLYIRQDVSLTKQTLGNYKQQATPAGNTWNMADWYTTK
jgi:ABC-type transport system substrate-binding protein